MTLLDRFVCRREGHKPALKLRATSGLTVRSYFATCIRCGKVVEVTETPDNPTGAMPT